MPKDARDFTIRYPGHPRYLSTKIVEGDPVEVILQKLEMVLFTNRGEVLGDPSFGASLEYYLWRTELPANSIKSEIDDQVHQYVPELNQMGYRSSVDLYKGSVRDIMVVNIFFSDRNVRYVLE